MEKKKINLFEKIDITDKDYAEKIVEKETTKFKFKLICTGVSLLTSIIWLFMDILEKSPGIIGDFFAILMILGWVATFIANPLTVIKTIWKCIYYGWYIVPIVFVDLCTAAIGFVIALFVLLYAPVIYCLIGLYSSYKAKKSAEEFLLLHNEMSKTTD